MKDHQIGHCPRCNYKDDEQEEYFHRENLKSLLIGFAGGVGCVRFIQALLAIVKEVPK